MTTNFPSNYAIGSDVVFSVPVENSTEYISIPCQVAGVKFVEGKVLYDLVFKVNEKYHTTRPVKDVDSIFVKESRD